LLDQVLAATREIGDPWHRSEALAALAPRLAALGNPTEALDTARVIEDKRRRNQVLAVLAAPGIDQALAAARWIGNQGHRSEPPAAPEELDRALVTARAIMDHGRRSEALEALATRLAKLPLGKLHPLWCASLRISATRTRKGLLTDLRALIPAMSTLGGADALIEVSCGIEEVGRWWP
jgi:hypothetical protein